MKICEKDLADKVNR